MRNMAFRRAINTPIQGGAADIVIAAMINIHANERLRTLGWKLILQIHD
jgi:DNA polymerase-1